MQSISHLAQSVANLEQAGKAPAHCIRKAVPARDVTAPEINCQRQAILAIAQEMFSQ